MQTISCLIILSFIIVYKNFVIVHHYYIKFYHSCKKCNFEETNDTPVFHWKTLPLGEFIWPQFKTTRAKEPVIVS